MRCNGSARCYKDAGVARPAADAQVLRTNRADSKIIQFTSDGRLEITVFQASVSNIRKTQLPIERSRV